MKVLRSMEAASLTHADNDFYKCWVIFIICNQLQNHHWNNHYHGHQYLMTQSVINCLQNDSGVLPTYGHWKATVANAFIKVLVSTKTINHFTATLYWVSKGCSLNSENQNVTFHVILNYYTISTHTTLIPKSTH